MLAEILQKYIFIFNIFYLKFFFLYLLSQANCPSEDRTLTNFPLGQG